MIAYLEKYDTTVDLPDGIGEKEVSDINENFHSYVDQKPQAPQPAQTSSGQPSPDQAVPTPEPTQQWQPNFYEGAIKPAMSKILLPLKAVGEATESPEAQAFAGKVLEQGTFGLSKPLTDAALSQDYKDHPAFAAAGNVTGGVGSLLAAGGLLRIAGLGGQAALAGKTAVEAGFVAGERFIPRAIMTGATFGTRTFIAETVKAFEEGGVNLEQFGKDVLKDTAFGSIFGTIGGLSNAAASVSSAGALGFISSKMNGADNREASLNAAIWATFETVGSLGRNEELRLEALKNLKASIGEYVVERNPGVSEKDAARAASAFVDNSMRKAGFETAEDLAKSGPENLLEGIEKANHVIRNARVPAGEPGATAALPKLPASIEPETAITPKAPEPAPKTPLEKVLETVKGMLGIKTETPAAAEPKPIEVKGDTYEEKIQSLKDQGLDISKMPESAFPEDMKDVFHFEQGKLTSGAMAKGLTEISERMNSLGVKTEEQQAILSQYDLDKTGQLGQPRAVSDLIHQPIEDQYKSAYDALAAQRGIDKGDKLDSRTMEDATKAVDLINGYFSPKSQMVFDFAKEHQELSDHAVAQMAYDRGLIDEPNTDLLKLELQKAKQESIPRQVVAQAMASDAQGPQGQQPTGTSPQNQPGSGSVSEADRRIVFPGPESPSLKSITSEPEYVNMAQKAAEIVHRYARERNIAPNHELAENLFTELHDALGEIMRAKPEDRLSVVEDLKKRYPTLENDFMVLRDQLYSDKTEPYFERQIKGKNVYPGKSEPTTSFSVAGGGTIPRTTVQRAPKTPAPTPTTSEEVSTRLKEVATEITDIINPAQAAPLAAQITRESLGKMARSYDMAEAALGTAKKYFDAQPKEANLDFIDKMERGQELSHTNIGKENTTLNIIAKQLRDLLDNKRKEIQSLGTGKMQSFIENYFPHIWDQGEKQVSQAVMKGAKRPFEGSKGFLKKRSIEFTKDGIEMGLTPVSFNPVDLALLKIREMDKYLAAHRTIQEYKKNGLAKYVGVGWDAPEGWVKIDDKISTIFKSPMVPVKEAYDAKIMKALTEVAKSLGINLERNTHAPKGSGLKSGDLWGLSQSDAMTSTPGKIWTRFAGPESVMAHELGHQLDHMYGLQNKFLGDKKINKELTELANERLEEGKGSKSFKEYIQKPSEKMAVMLESYIHAPDLLQEKAPRTYKALETFLTLHEKLRPLTQVEPSLVMAVNKGEVYAGGNVIAGHIYAQPDAAKIINNYLSPGLQKSAIYQSFRYAGNLINQFQLGLSAFHLGFTSLDSTISKFALGLNELAAGHPLNAIKDALQSPFAPVQNIIRGNDLLKAWRGEGRSGIDNVLADVMASAGGRAQMDQFYATKAYDQMKHHFEAGNIVRGILHIPLSIAETSSKPILEWIVPRQKLGVFADMIKMEMENNPNMSHQQMRAIAQKAWDSVDNRMGQLVYDNLFWNRTFKDLLMASVRSVGWNLGTIRELIGGAEDYAEFIANAARGKKSEFSYRMAYFTALPIVVGMLGAITQYLRTGKGPQELKDYYFPKTGGIDASGNPSRVSLPSYMKDVYHWSQNPGKVAIDKLHPIFSIVADSFQNKDYYGTKIRNEDDPLVRQVASEAVFILKQVMPFSIRNMQKNMETGNKTLFDTVGPWVGVTPAPYDINQTKAEKLAHEIAASHQEIGGRTQEQMERSKLIGDLTRQFRRGDPKATDNLYLAYQQGLISHRQMQNVIVHSTMTPLQRMVSGFSLQETQRVYEKADDEEKAQIERILRKKEINKEREYVSTGAN